MDIKRIVAYSLVGSLTLTCFFVYRALDERARGKENLYGDFRQQNITSAAPAKSTDEIAQEQATQTRQAELEKKAATWTPPDVVRGRVFRSGNRAVAFFQFKVEFYDDPKISEYKDLSVNYIHDLSEMLKIDAPVKKTMTFKHRFEFLPNGPDPKNQFFLCTTLLADLYNGATDEERAMIGAKGIHAGYPEYGNLPYVNEAGEHEQFCGVLSLSGETVYKFPITQHAPDLIVKPLGFSADEKSAGIILGGNTIIDSEDGPSNQVGNPREVWIWRSDQLTKVSTTTIGVNDMQELRRMFFQGRL